MFRFLLKRLALTVPTFIALMFVTFMLIRLVPGDPIEARRGERGISPERLAELRHEIKRAMVWIGMVGLAVLCIAQRGKRFVFSAKGPPLPGISLAEAAVWLGLVPLLVYFATFWPAFHYATRPVDPWGIVQYQGYMVQLQDSVVKKHNYMSHWWQWVLDIRSVWYLYENVDGTQRGVVLIGNPVPTVDVHLGPISLPTVHVSGETGP